MSAREKIDSVYDFTDKGLVEVKAWLEPWFVVRGKTDGEGGGIDFNKGNNADAEGDPADYLSITVNGTGNTGSDVDPTAISIVNAADEGQFLLVNDTDDLMLINQTGDADLEIRNDGNGDVNVKSLGGGDVLVRSSNGTVTITADGDVTINSAHNFVVVSSDGYVKMPNLPTVDPHVVAQLWNSSGTVKVSAG